MIAYAFFLGCFLGQANLSLVANVGSLVPVHQIKRLGLPNPKDLAGWHDWAIDGAQILGWGSRNRQFQASPVKG